MENVSYGRNEIECGNVKRLHTKRAGPLHYSVVRTGSGVQSTHCEVRRMRDRNNCCVVKSFSAEKPL